MKSRLQSLLQDSFNTADAYSDEEDSDEESAEIEEEDDEEEDGGDKGNEAEDEAYMKRLDREAAKISVSSFPSSHQGAETSMYAGRVGTRSLIMVSVSLIDVSVSLWALRASISHGKKD